MSTIGPNKTKNQTHEGKVIEWELLFASKPPFKGLLPFFIDWLACTNPKDSNPSGGHFNLLLISDSFPKKLQRFLTELGLPVTVTEGKRSISVLISGNKGLLSLSSTTETNRISLR